MGKLSKYLNGIQSCVRETSLERSLQSLHQFTFAISQASRRIDLYASWGHGSNESFAFCHL